MTSIILPLVLACSQAGVLAAQDHPFIRGDTTRNGLPLDITDPIATLGFLFLGSLDELPCLDAADSNDSGGVDLTDAIYTLGFLFLGGPAPPGPYPLCQEDPTEDTLSCASSGVCPPFLPQPVLEPLPPKATRQATIELTGRVNAGERVIVRGGRIHEERSADAAGRFRIPLTLAQNVVNKLFVSAVRPNRDESAPTPVSIAHDGQAPLVRIDEPETGTSVTREQVIATGRVSDMLSGFMRLTVFVKSLPLEAALPDDHDSLRAFVMEGIGTNGTFARQDVPLQEGENEVRAIAFDSLGNRQVYSSLVRRVSLTPGRPFMVIPEGGGDGQVGEVFQELPQPLKVQLFRSPGQPFAGKLVTFEVSRNDGTLAEIPGVPKADAAQTLQLRTDAQGIAQVFYRLGETAGTGNNRVWATSTSIEGTVLFCASALPGPPLQINIGSLATQRAELGSLVPEPLSVWVSDGCNGIAGVPVTFQVVRGGGGVDGAASVTILTDRTGHAEVSFKLGDQPGNQVVIADFAGNIGLPARFTVFGVPRSPLGQTSLRGLVLSNARVPLGGATCYLQVPGYEVFEAVSNIAEPKGEFLFEHIPGPGGIVFLDVYGDTIKEGSYPTLSYDIVLIPGANNTLPAPVLLPLLDPRNERTYSTTQDTVLMIEGVEGLRMTVAANSMRLPSGDGTFSSAPDGTRMSLNQVHHDDIPMPLPDGVAPPFAWTLQPAGARFDPPVRIEYPNMSALAPGAIANFLSFNHDTRRFEIVASGHVVRDGSIIVTDPDAGLTVSGWGCNCPPYAVTGDCMSCPLERIQVKLPGSMDFKDSPPVLKILIGSLIEFRAVASGGNELPTNQIVWQGSTGVLGTGEAILIRFDVTSQSNRDFKTITARCNGVVIEQDVLVVDRVLGVHSNKGAGDRVTDWRDLGHAWISHTLYSAAGAITTTLGLWPDDHRATFDNGEEPDVRYGLEPGTGIYNRYYLLDPEQHANFESYLLLPSHHWRYTFTCASFASCSIAEVIGEDVDADDILGFETPRELGESIEELERANPTSALNPSAPSPNGSSTLNSFTDSFPF